MNDIAADLAKDPLTWALAGLGITVVPVNAYIGSVLLSLAAAGLAAHWRPERDRKELWVIMLTGLFVAHMCLLISERHYPGWPAQFVMPAGAFASRFLIRMALAVLGRAETKTDIIADRVIDRVLPGGGPKP